MIFWVLLLSAAFGAGPVEGLIEQRQAVEQAAEAVAKARQEGARRQEIARLMAVYRELAERLETLERESAVGSDELKDMRTGAQREVSEALAKGKAATEARKVLADWLGDPADRLKVLEMARTTVEGLEEPALQKDILLDAIEQCQALALVLSYDVFVLEQEASRLRMRAANLVRRDAPGQEGSMTSEVEARRLEEKAVVVEKQRDESSSLRQAANLLLEQLREVLEPHP